MVNLGEKVLESSDVKLINLAPYVFDVNHVVEIKSGLYILFSVLEKKELHKIIALKSDLNTETFQVPFSVTSLKS